MDVKKTFLQYKLYIDKDLIEIIINFIQIQVINTFINKNLHNTFAINIA